MTTSPHQPRTANKRVMLKPQPPPASCQTGFPYGEPPVFA